MHYGKNSDDVEFDSPVLPKKRRSMLNTRLRTVLDSIRDSNCKRKKEEINKQKGTKRYLSNKTVNSAFMLSIIKKVLAKTG